jgi:GNAT superfamily N-acetyltransferase
MPLSIALTTEALADDVKVLSNGLNEHATSLGVGDALQHFAIFARESGGAIRGGLAGYTCYGMLYVSVLWVDDNERGKGLGRQLMAMAEAEGRRRGCHIAGLSTLSYQAPDFYKKIGYVERSRIDGMGPDRDISRIDFIKQLS